MTTNEVLKTLQGLGTAQNVKVYRRHGAGENLYGVSFADLRGLAKKIKTDHALALELWGTGNIDARSLAILIADPSQLDTRTADAWITDIEYYLLADLLGGLVAKSTHGVALMKKWMKSKAEYMRAAGYVVLACELEDGLPFSEAHCRAALEQIEGGIHLSPNRARHSMNMALIAIGAYVPSLRAEAIQAARRIGRVVVDHGETGCKTPDAESYILKTVAHQERKKVPVTQSRPLRGAAISALLFVLSFGICANPGAPAWGEETAVKKELPPAVERPVDFDKDIKPILQNTCIRCHGRGKDQGGFKIDTRETILEGGGMGPVLEVGKSADSYFVHLVAGTDPKLRMPPEGDLLSDEQIGLLRAWIDQGLIWEEGFTLGRFDEAPLAPRQVELPTAEESGYENSIDRLVAAYEKKHKLTMQDPVDDRIFARRVYLDVVGLLPPQGDLEAFLADESPDKRAALVDRLLADEQGYAENWMTFWNDALRNDFAGTGYIDGGREQITEWLYGALKSNLPYDQFVANLVHPATGSRGFIKGIVWRGVVNSSQTPEMQAAQNVSQIFLGINMKCASCHDSFTSNWKLEDSHNLASVFAENPIPIFRCDTPTGATAEAKFLYSDLGAIPPDLGRDERLAKLAEIMTSEQNGRLTRTIVNRLWARFLGRGLVEPVDELDRPPWDADLLDWLAVDLAKHDYDLKHTIRLILTSRAYQMPSVTMDLQHQDQYVFEGPVVRRLTAEQFRDAFAAVSGVWPATPATSIRLTDDASAEVRVRAWHLIRDPLANAMGRPNREQLITSRPSMATTLEAVELSNGATLSNLLKQGAAYLVESVEKESGELVDAIFLSALGRTPNEDERNLALELLGVKPSPEGVEDLLWAVAMLPEFQLIY